MSADLQTMNFSLSTESGAKTKQPMLRKELLYQIDNNGTTNYSRNTVQFETTSWANNGRWVNFQEGFVSFPLVMKITRDAGNPISSDDAKQMLQMKTSNLAIIDSVQIEMNNTVITQQIRNLSPYLIFKQHTTLSLSDLEIHGTHLGYQKHQNTFSFDAQMGIKNNDVLYGSFYHEEINADVLSTSDMQASGMNCQEVKDAGLSHLFFYDCIVRLKDLPFFEKMPMIRGAQMKLTFVLNQGSVSITKAVGDYTAFTPSLSGSFFPVLRKSGTEMDDFVENISVRVVENDSVKHPSKTQCRLYVPVYTMQEEVEQKYLHQGTKTIRYHDVHFQRVRNLKNESFHSLLTNSLARCSRLIVVPVLSASMNGTLSVDPQASPMCPDGVGTCSPYCIQAFNVAVSGSNIYQNGITFKYDSFLNEMDGSQGVNGGRTTGVASGLIDLRDYESNYGYLVVDLSRRGETDDNLGVSIQISGQVVSKKELDLLCYLEYEKDVTVDLATGRLM